MEGNNTQNIYSANLPYPEIKVEKKNLRYANILLHNYSGMVSELTTITQYVHHKFKVFESTPKLAEAFGGIAMVEMHHLDILGKVIELLGEDPRFWIRRKDKRYYWDAKFVDYGTSIKEYLTYDIQAEVITIRDYNNVLNEISDPYITQIIERIILDEEVHLKIFKNLYDEYVTKA